MRSLSFFSRGSSKKKAFQSTPSRRIEDPLIDSIIDSAAEIIEKWNTEYSTSSNFYSLFSESKREAKEFVINVKNLQKVMDQLMLEDPNAEQLLKALDLMNIAMKRLMEEFYQILSMTRAHLDPDFASTRSSSSSIKSGNTDHSPECHGRAHHPASDSIIEVEEMSMNAMADLKSIAECMLAAGYAKECVSMYKSLRKSIVDEGMYILGVETISPSKAKKMPWEVVELKTKNWLEALKVSLTALFIGERVLCDYVYKSSDSIRESCFGDISNDGALLLFGFPEIVAAKDNKNSPPEKIFLLLEMYSAISENLQAITSIFSLPLSSPVLPQAFNTLSSLRDMICSLVDEFESGIQRDTSKTMVQGAGVHPLTISAMNYLSLLADRSDVLADILMCSPPVEISLLPESYFNGSESDGSPASELRIRFAWLILVLLCKIDAKAELYKDFSEQYLFLANNLQHVVSCVRSRQSLRNLLGDDWVARLLDKTRQFAANYERLAWGPVASALPDNPSTAAMSPEAVMECFEAFGTRFVSAYKKQGACEVSDPKLRDEMRISIARKLVPMYREFYNAHRSTVEMAEKEWGLVVRFTPEDVGSCVSELFSVKGNLGKTHASLSSASSFSVASSSPSCPPRQSRSLSCRRY